MMTELRNNPNIFSIGDHLTVERKLYTHHGLYAGNGFVIENLLEQGIVCVSLEDFADGKTIHVQKHSHPKYNGVQAVARAMRRLGEEKYNLITFNCEHFVNWCIEGCEVSRQVDNILSVLHPIAKHTVNIPVVGEITKKAYQKAIEGHISTDQNDFETSAHFDAFTQLRQLQSDILGSEVMSKDYADIMIGFARSKLIEYIDTQNKQIMCYEWAPEAQETETMVASEPMSQVRSLS